MASFCNQQWVAVHRSLCSFESIFHRNVGEIVIVDSVNRHWVFKYTLYARFLVGGGKLLLANVLRLISR